MADKGKFIQALSAVLVEHRIFSLTRTNELQKEFGDSSIDEFEDFLLQEGLVRADEMLKALSKLYKVPFRDVVGPVYDSEGHFFETHLLREFPKEFLLRNAIIPLDVENHTTLTVVAADPSRPGLESAIRGFVSYDVIFFVGIRRDIIDAVEQYYDDAVTQVPGDIDINEEVRNEREAERIMIGDDEQDGNAGL